MSSTQPSENSWYNVSLDESQPEEDQPDDFWNSGLIHPDVPTTGVNPSCSILGTLTGDLQYWTGRALNATGRMLNTILG